MSKKPPQMIEGQGDMEKERRIQELTLELENLRGNANELMTELDALRQMMVRMGEAKGTTSLSRPGEKLDSRQRRAPTEGTTFVPTDFGQMVEVGAINAKRDFIISEHMLGRLPEHAPAGEPLGNITLVGAGPGDPDLLTLAAHKAIMSADVVVADRLVSQEILQLVQHGQLKVARKLPGCALEAQREIYRWCAEAVLAGKNVVRLKIGDPYVFGRGGEEVLEFRRLGVEARVIPGISSALAGPLAAGIPVTHRGIANRVVFCTGMSKEETVPDVPHYHAEQTCVFLMAVGILPQLVHALTGSMIISCKMIFTSSNMISPST